MSPKKGAILKTAFETYTVQAQLGAGGAGTVYSVTDSDNGAHAVKVLDRTRATTVALKRFQNEINFCSRNEHKNIIRVTDRGLTPDDEPFYVMPQYSESLRKRMLLIQPTDVLPIFGNILDGVEAAHLQQVWHRDLKPENVLCGLADGEIVLADFGIARFNEDELITAVETRNDERLANFVYAAPEQRVRNHAVTGAADIYALGLMLNEMYTGKVPQGAGYRRISEVAPDFSYLDKLVELMIQQDPQARPASTTGIKQELVARGNEFLEAQKLSALKKQVIPDSEIDDPFVSNPIRIIRIADYHDRVLTFELSAAPPPNWVTAFRQLGSYSSIMGSGPPYFSFYGKLAHVPVHTESAAQAVVNHAKNYVQQANEAYRENAVREHQRQLVQRREALKRKIEEEENRSRLMSALRL